MITAELHDGRRLEFPDGTDPAVVQATVKRVLGSTEAPPREELFAEKLGRGVLNAGAGAIRGAGSIGATLLAPYDMARDALAGRGLSLESNRQRRADMTAGLGSLGADTDSLAFGAGKLGGEIAGTLGVGGAIANAGARVLPAGAPLLETIRTAGMSAGGMTGLGGLAARSVGGGITGGAATTLVNPEDAGTGAMIGAALPGGLQVAGKAGRAVAKGVKDGAANLLGLTTGVGAEPIRQAVKAGRQGNAAFIANMRGDVPIDDVLDDAKRGLDAMRAAKSAQYRSGMVPIKNDQTVLSFTDLDAAFQKAGNVATFKGQVKNQRAFDAITRMREAVDEWKGLDPQQFHTPEGMDALKQRLSAILEGIPFEERGARLAAGEIYSAAKATIGKQAPTYAKVMKDYQVASDSIKEIERALSLGDKASKDTAMRKLQSLMRNNVQTNYGNRLNLANELELGGNVELLPSLSGQALSSATPRSLSGQIGSGGALLGSLMTGNPLMLGALPFQSPRLVGEAAYKLGGLLGPSGAAGGSAQGLLGGAGGAQSITDDFLLPLMYRAAPVVGVGR
jgi:hypothetical protein